MRSLALWRRLLSAAGVDERAVGGVYAGGVASAESSEPRDWKPLFAGAGWCSRFYRLMMVSTIAGRPDGI